MSTLIDTPEVLRPERFHREAVVVDGEAFSVATWSGTSSPVLAIHGISSNHLLWSWTAAAGPDLHLIAPDLRGRGASTLEGPFGLARHRDDMLRLMDALGLERVVLAGMSLGGYVATAMAEAAPDRFSAVVLIDGGIPTPLPDAVREAVFADLDARGAADETFDSVAGYADTWLAKMGQDLERADPLLEAFMAWNLRAEDGRFAARMPGAAMSQDSRDVFGGAPVERWLAALEMPVHLLHADSPLGPVDAAGWAHRLPRMVEEHVPDVDHATIVMGRDGGRRVAEVLRRYA